MYMDATDVTLNDLILMGATEIVKFDPINKVVSWR